MCNIDGSLLPMHSVALLYGFSLVLYYAVVSDVITSVAHIAAFTMGAVIGGGFCRVLNSRMATSLIAASGETDGLVPGAD